MKWILSININHLLCISAGVFQAATKWKLYYILRANFSCSLFCNYELNIILCITDLHSNLSGYLDKFAFQTILFCKLAMFQKWFYEYIDKSVNITSVSKIFYDYWMNILQMSLWKCCLRVVTELWFVFLSFWSGVSFLSKI
jgi:hypothetical protein